MATTDDELANMLNQLVDLDDAPTNGNGASNGAVGSPTRMIGASELLAGLSAAGPSKDNLSASTGGSAMAGSPQSTFAQPQVPQAAFTVQQQQQPQQFTQQQQQPVWGQQQQAPAAQQQFQPQQPQQQQQQQMWVQQPQQQQVQQQQQQQQPRSTAGSTVYMNGQYYQVPPGMQLAQVTATGGFDLAPGQAGYPQQQQQQQQAFQQQPQQQQQGPMVMQVGPDGRLVPAPQAQVQTALSQQRGAVAYQQPHQQQQQPQQQGAQVLTVPPGMTADQFLAQLQSQGLSGQVLTPNAPAAQPQPQQQPAPSQQQQQQPAPQYTAPTSNGQPTPSWARGQQGQSQRGSTTLGTRSAAESVDDLTKLNPKAQPFVPKDGSESPGRASPNSSDKVTGSNTQAAVPSPAAATPAPPAPPASSGVKKAPDAHPLAPIKCPHCDDSNFLTEYVLRSHIKAKHSADLPSGGAGGEAGATGSDGTAESPSPAVTALLEIVRQYLTVQCAGGSCSLDVLTTYLDSTHAVAMGEALSGSTFSEVLQMGGLRRFSYSGDELARAEVKPEVAVAGENRVALPNIDYMANDTARSKE